jgi:hypothetical protein
VNLDELALSLDAELPIRDEIAKFVQVRSPCFLSLRVTGLQITLERLLQFVPQLQIPSILRLN